MAGSKLHEPGPLCCSMADTSPTGQDQCQDLKAATRKARPDRAQLAVAATAQTPGPQATVLEEPAHSHATEGGDLENIAEAGCPYEAAAAVAGANRT